MRVRALAALLVLCWFGPAALAATVEVTGRIVDPSGGALPGVTVTLTTIAGTELPSEGVTDAQGTYTFNAAPGRYRLHAELPGFAAVDRDIVVGTFPFRLDLQLALAVLSQEVTVVAEAPRPLM